MNENQKIHIAWLEEDLEHINTLRETVGIWQRILKNRVFDGSWPNKIQPVIESLKHEIIKEIEKCHNHIQTIREESSAESGKE